MEEINFMDVDLEDLTIRMYGGEGREYKFVSHDKKNNCILIKTNTGGYSYDVDLDRCKTAAQCLDWIHQLHVKTWFDAEREKEFIDLLLRLIPSELWSGA